MLSIRRATGILSALIALAELTTGIAAPANAAETCFQNATFYNESGYVVSNFVLTDSSGDVWSSPNQYSLAQSVTVDLTNLGLKDDAKIGTYINVMTRGDRTWGPSITYCRNSQTTGVKAYGTVFSPQLGAYTP